MATTEQYREEYKKEQERKCSNIGARIYGTEAQLNIAANRRADNFWRITRGSNRIFRHFWVKEDDNFVKVGAKTIAQTVTYPVYLVINASATIWRGVFGEIARATGGRHTLIDKPA